MAGIFQKIHYTNFHLMANSSTALIFCFNLCSTSSIRALLRMSKFHPGHQRRRRFELCVFHLMLFWAFSFSSSLRIFCIRFKDLISLSSSFNSVSRPFLRSSAHFSIIFSISSSKKNGVSGAYCVCNPHFFIFTQIFKLLAARMTIPAFLHSPGSEKAFVPDPLQGYLLHPYLRKKQDDLLPQKIQQTYRSMRDNRICR